MATEILRPNGTGDVTNITSQYPASTSHWDKVDEASADDLTTYVYTTDASRLYDLYTLSNHVGSGPINSVKIYHRIGGDGSPGANFRPVIKTEGSIYYGGWHSPGTSSFITYSDTWLTNPYTSSAWTWEQIDALQVGSEVYRSQSGSYEGRCTQIYIEVDYTSAVTVNIDTLLEALDSETVNIDTLLEALDSETVAIDTILKAIDTKTVDLDTLLKALSDTKTADLDTLLQALGITKTVDLDSILKAIDTKTVDMDALLRDTDTATVSLSTLLRGFGIPETIDIDTLLKTIGDTKTIDIDTLLVMMGSETVDLDAILKAIDTKTVDLDAILKALSNTNTVDLDILLRALGVTKTVDLDTLLVTKGTKTVDLDTLLLALGVANTVDLDILLRTLGVTETVDLDAYLEAVDSETIDLDAILRGVGTKTVTLDALLHGFGITETIDLDVLLQAQGITTTVDLDTLLMLEGTLTITIDVILVSYPEPALKYVLEVHQASTGNLIAILNNAHVINYSEATNEAPVLSFELPGDDDKAVNIIKANEIWIRDYESGAVIKKFRLAHRGDIRQ
jgi:hypothetical protein